MATWRKITGSISGTIVDMILDPFYPKYRAWVITSNSIYKTLNLNDSIPTWTRIAQTTDFFDSSLNPEFVRVRNTAAKKYVYYILMYAKVVSTDIESRQYVLRSDDNGSTWSGPTWTGLTDVGYSSGGSIFGISIDNSLDPAHTDTVDSLSITDDAIYTCGRDGTATGILAIYKRDPSSGESVWFAVDANLSPANNNLEDGTHLATDDTYLYLFGKDSLNWVVQCRRLIDGVVVWSNSTTPADVSIGPGSVCCNSTSVFAAGFIRNSSPAKRGWRIARYDKSNGSSGWAVTNLVSVSTDFKPYHMVCDESFVYVVGSEYDSVNSVLMWRIECRSALSGGLVWSRNVQPTTSSSYWAVGVALLGDAVFVLGSKQSNNGCLIKKLTASTGFDYSGSWADYSVSPTPSSASTFCTLCIQGLSADSSGVYAAVVEQTGGSPNTRRWQVLKLNPTSGALIWRTLFGGNTADYPQTIGISEGGRLAVGGTFQLGATGFAGRLVGVQGSTGDVDKKKCLSVGQHNNQIVYTANKSTVVKSTNGSSSFSNLITTNGANDIECFVDGNSDDSSIYFWGNDGGLYRYTTINGVVSLALTESAKNRHLRLRSFITDKNTIYTFKHLGSDTWSLMKSTNGGVSWTTQSTGLLGIRSLVLWAFSSARLLFLSSSAIYYSTNSGVTLVNKIGNWATVVSAFADPIVIGAVWLG